MAQNDPAEDPNNDPAPQDPPADPPADPPQDPPADPENQPSPQSLHEMLPEDLRDDPALKDFKDVGSLAKSYRETKSMQGNSIRIPGEDASDEDKQAFYEKLAERAPGVMPKPNFDDPDQSKEFWRSLGMPETPDKYTLPEVEGLEMDDDRIQFLKEAAHQVRATNKQFEGIMQQVLQKDAEDMTAQQQEREKGFQKLKEEWGHAYSEKAQVADRVREQFMPFVPKDQMGAETMRAFAKIGEQMGGEQSEMLHQQSDGTNVTPAEARAQIDEIMRNPQHPYWIADDPGHKDAMDRMIRLQKQANPTASTSLNSLRASS